MKKNIIPDEPINNFEDDILGRENFARNLANSLTSWEERKSLVIGLFGKWGSGKTSVVNLTKQYLKGKIKEGKKKKGNPIIVDFNPWGYSETGDLFSPFIRQIKESINNKNRNRMIKKILDKLDNLLSVINEVHPIKNVSSLVTDMTVIIAVLGLSITQIFPSLNNGIKLFFSWVGYTSLIIVLIAKIYSIIKKDTKKESISKIKKEISNILVKNDIRLIIIIDDIDRLTSAEIKQLFRIIRINADFPNTIYLLSFDRNIVEKSLTVQDTISGHDYLEKIINIEYDLPGITKFRLEKYFRNNLENMISQLPEEADNIFSKEKIKWAFIYPIIISELSSIRDIKRFFNAISFKLSQFINKNILEINLVDLFGIELLRLKYPDCYSFIRDNKPRFLSLKKELDDEKETYVRWFDEIFHKFSSNSRSTANIITIVTQLFPIAYYKSKNIPISSSAQPVNDVTCSIASEKFFDIYFDHISSIAEGECSNYDVQYIKTVSSNYNLLSAAIQEYIKTNKIHSLLQLLENHSIENTFPKENILTYFIVLFDLINDIPDNHERLKVGNEYIIYRIVFYLLRNNNKEDNDKIFESLFQKTKDSFMCVFFIENMIRACNEHTEYLVSFDELSCLKQKAIEKIIEDKDNLLNSKYYLRILPFWKENAYETFKLYVSTVKNDNNKFLEAFDKSIYKVYSESLLGIEKIDQRFDYKGFELFGSLEETKKIIQHIKLTENGLYNKYKKSIDLFLRDYDKKNNNKY